MIVLVLSDQRVLTGWATIRQAETWRDIWLTESRDRWAWIVQTTPVSETEEMRRLGDVTW